MTLEGYESRVTNARHSDRKSRLLKTLQPETLAHKKLRKAAQEFEGMLISQLLSEFQMGLSLALRGFPPDRVRYLELLGNSDVIGGSGPLRRARNWANAGSSARAKLEPRPTKSGRGKD